MKTFKLISLAVMEDDKSVDIPLDHGLIINKEDENSTWLLEAYTKLSLYDFFKKIDDEKSDIIVQVVITKPDNDPVFLQTKLTCLQLFKEHISVLLEGQLRKVTKNHSEILIDRLIKQGLSGDDLLAEFKKTKRAVPRVK